MENRAQEVGIALLTPSLSEITLTQVVDNSLYSHTRAFLNLMDTNVVIFSQSLVGTPLHQILLRNNKQGAGDNQSAVAQALYKSAVKSAVKDARE